jgi:addiction module HigA family antidote
MLLKELLEPMGMTQVELAKHLGRTWPRINEIVNGRRGVTADSALAFGEAFSTGPEFWLNLQRDWDLWHVMKKRKLVIALKKAS